MFKINSRIVTIFLLSLINPLVYAQEKISITLDLINDTVGELENYYIEIKIENNYSKGIAIKSNLSSFYNFKIRDKKGELISNSWWFKGKINEAKTNNSKYKPKAIDVFKYKHFRRVPHSIVKMNPFNEVFILKKSDYRKFKCMMKLHKIYEDRLLFVIPDDYTKSYYIEPNHKIIMRQNVNNLVKSGETFYIDYEINDSLSSRDYRPEQISHLKSEHINGILVLSLYDDLYYFVGTLKSNTITINGKKE